jgi:Ca2+-transporting ATPase
MAFSWFAEEIDDVLRALKVTRAGLSNEEATSRLIEYGPNELSEGKKVSPFEIFLNQFKNIFVIMLIAATLITYYIDFMKNEVPIDALTIATIVVINAVIGFVQEYRSEKALEAMKQLSAPNATVLRDGKEDIVPAKNVVPGDILLLETGDRIAADARLLDVVELRTDEAVLTGESTPVTKGVGVVGENEAIGDRKNMIFTATHIVYGRGKAVVTATGMGTEFGKIAEMVQTTEEKETPLKRRLERFAKLLGIFVMIISAIVFALELLNPNGPGDITESFLTAVALAVSAVPEGLPAVVTVTLALGSRELVKRNALIRKLTSVETLGATTVICSDKTGTLTKGEMTVRRIYTNSETVEVMGVGYEAKGDFVLQGKVVNANEDPNLSLLLTGAALCSNASYDGTRVIGDTTEGALLVAATKAGLTKEELEKRYPRVREIPFTSERQRMTTVHERQDGTLIGFMKGAPGVVLSCCTHIFSDGTSRKLSSRERSAILERNVSKPDSSSSG